jgi:hypothetical protein
MALKIGAFILASCNLISASILNLEGGVTDFGLIA